MTQGAEVAEGVFTYNPQTKALAFNDGEIADNTEIVVYYMRQIQADVLENLSDHYSGKCALYIDAFAEDTEGSVTLAQLHADVQTAIGKAHSHTNKAELDKIVTGDKAKWDAAEQKAHEHGNKTILDAISQDKVDAWDGAVTKQHEHANKTVLDGISAEKVADWDSKAAGNHEHDITELKQASGYIVFNCGSASVNI